MFVPQIIFSRTVLVCIPALMVSHQWLVQWAPLNLHKIHQDRLRRAGLTVTQYGWIDKRMQFIDSKQLWLASMLIFCRSILIFWVFIVRLFLFSHLFTYRDTWSRHIKHGRPHFVYISSALMYALLFSFHIWEGEDGGRHKMDCGNYVSALKWRTCSR